MMNPDEQKRDPSESDAKRETSLADRVLAWAEGRDGTFRAEDVSKQFGVTKEEATSVLGTLVRSRRGIDGPSKGAYQWLGMGRM